MLILEAFFNKTIIPVVLVGYEMIIAMEVHLISTARSGNNC